MDEYGRWEKLKWCDNRNVTQHIKPLINIHTFLFHLYKFPLLCPHLVFHATR